MSDVEFEPDLSFPILSQEGDVTKVLPILSQEDLENSRNISFLRNNGRRYFIFEFYSYTAAFQRMDTKPVIKDKFRVEVIFYTVRVVWPSVFNPYTVRVRRRQPRQPHHYIIVESCLRTKQIFHSFTRPFDI